MKELKWHYYIKHALEYSKIKPEKIIVKQLPIIDSSSIIQQISMLIILIKETAICYLKKNNPQFMQLKIIVCFCLVYRCWNDSFIYVCTVEILEF